MDKERVAQAKDALGQPRGSREVFGGRKKEKVKAEAHRPKRDVAGVLRQGCSALRSESRRVDGG